MTTNYWKHPTYGHVYCGEIATPIGRLIYPSLVKPKEMKPQEGQAPGAPRYEASLLLPKTDPKVIAFITKLEELVKGGLAVFNEKRSTTTGINSIFGKYGDGDSPSYDPEKYPHHKGNWVIAGRNAEQPKVVDINGDAVTPDVFKGGMLCRMVVTPLITAHGASYKAMIVQLVKDDEVRYAGGVRSVDDLVAILNEENEAPSEEAKTVAAPAAVPVEPVPAPQVTKKAATAKGVSGGVNLLR
jgi:hypothetical protein